MKEIYIIFSKTTEEIISAGRVNRNEIHDGSTVYENIVSGLSENPDYDVIYLPDQNLPDKYKEKVKDGKLKKRDSDWKPQKEIYEDLISAEIRSGSIQRLIASGDLPEGYK